LAQLEERVRYELSCLNYPAAQWVPEERGPDGAPLLDTLIIGGGMCGQTLAFALRRDGVGKVRIIDRAPRGLEGPWATFARMETLRSPKQLTGPDLGVPSLTFRQWYEAQHGADGWERLYKIPRVMWRDYLLWLREVLVLPVENDTSLVALEPAAQFVAARIEGPVGATTVHARHVILAVGREGSGAPRAASFPSYDAATAAARSCVLHAAADIDFAALAGKRIGVLGIGATAFDNAATALEAGAATVTMFARRTFIPQVNKSKWASFPGFQHGYAAADDATRWRFMTYINDEQVPPPHESVLRCMRHRGFALRLGEPWLDLTASDDAVRVTTSKGYHVFDAVILAIGFDVDLVQRPEIAAFRDNILCWGDRVAAEEAWRHPEEARYPYLGPGFELLPRLVEATPGISRVHVFNWGSTLSHGQLAGDIPGLATGVTRLATAIARSLFLETNATLFGALQAFDEPELKPTPYFVPCAQRLV
jgi:cation diffusion facilitator CzcD-associated flavoprotein CzcO